MNIKRGAAYGGALLLVAWFASAGGVVRQDPDVRENPKPVETAGTTTLAADVQAQAERLKTRLSQAPEPQEPFRNPFTFHDRAAETGRRAPAIELAPPPAPAMPPEPAIELIGVAEDQSPKGPVRTAVISALSGELFLVKEGEAIVGRYRVTKIGADAVELSDLASGAVRRLALKND